MVFGVSTLGCPGLPLKQVAALLHAHGVGAVQLRCAEDEPIHVGVDATRRRAARRLLADEGLRLLGLATYVRLTEGAADLGAHLELARDLGAPALRIMPGGAGDPAEHVGPAAEALAAAVDSARGSGVRLLVETHDAFLRGADVRLLIETAGTGGVGAIWDALHPWRAGEAPAETARALAPWLGEVQLKDVESPLRRRPLVPGTGTVPCLEVLAQARAAGFGGPVVLEHEARWYPDAAPIGDAIDGALAVLAASGAGEGSE